MFNSFWTGGPDAYARALRDQYEPLLCDLRKRRGISDECEQAKIESEIKRIEAEYKSKLDSIDGSLF